MPLIDTKAKKRELRARHKKIRQNCPQNLKRELDFRITQSFLSLEEYKSCTTIFAFISSPIEVNTAMIIDSAFSDGKKVAVPRCRDKAGRMDFYYISSYSQLKKGMYGIYEPDESCEAVVGSEKNPDESRVCLVPGLCFDISGFRVGFGKGYYDRFLEHFDGIKVGICYSKCMEKQIPAGNFDRPVDIIVTEKYVSRIPLNKGRIV